MMFMIIKNALQRYALSQIIADTILTIDDTPGSNDNLFLLIVFPELCWGTPLSFAEQAIEVR